MIEQLAYLRGRAERCVEHARRRGADVAEADIIARDELAVRVRDGGTDLVQRGMERAVRLRVVKDQRTSAVVSNDLAEDSLDHLAADAIELLDLVLPDPCVGPPPRRELARGQLPDLNLWDEDTLLLGIDEARRRAEVAERAARAFDARVSHVEASCGSTLEATILVTSDGFAGEFATTYQALMVQAICEDALAGRKLVNRHFSASRFLGDLDEPETVGREAAGGVIAQIGTRELAPCEVPVVFHPNAGRVLLQLLPSVLNATAIINRTSFLADREGKPVGSPRVTVIDDPLVPRAIGSRPFDAEGLRAQAVTVIDRGVLRTFLTDTYGARRLRRTPTAAAVRTATGTTVGAASNLILLPGPTPARELVSDLAAGVYITQLMGASFDPMTGMLARAAAGFWVEQGQLAYPIGRISLATSLATLLERIDTVGDDLDFRTAFACPTFRISHLRLG